MSRIEAKDGKESTKAEEKERKDLAKRLELSVLCKQAKDSDLVEAKGKGRGKGRGKGKEKKGGKGKKGKGKSKGKGKKGKGKRLGRTVCRICHQEGHWGNECPNRHSVRNVEAEEQVPETETYVHNPPNQDQYLRSNVVESGIQES